LIYPEGNTETFLSGQGVFVRAGGALFEGKSGDSDLGRSYPIFFGEWIIDLLSPPTTKTLYKQFRW